MNGETTDKITVYAKTRKADNTQDTRGAFPKPTSIRYVTDMRYLEEYSGSTGVS